MGKLFDSLPDSFLKKVLSDENSEIVEQLLTNKNNYEKETDKDKKVIYRERLASSFWQLYADILMKLNENTPKEKRLFIRYGILDLKYLTTEDQKLILSQPFEEKDPENCIYYVDEWFLEIKKGNLKPSMTDEQSPRKSDAQKDSAMQTKLEKLAGIIEIEKRNYINAAERRRIAEEALVAIINSITTHSMDSSLGAADTYQEDQIKKMDEIADTIREIKKYDKEMCVAKRGYYEKFEEYQNLESEINANYKDNNTPIKYNVDSRTIENEISCVRQMVKMCIGRQGNHFPIAFSAFLPKETRNYNFKSISYQNIKNIEELDPTIFERKFRQNTHRIYPNILLTPGYGNYGICWEPYDRYNKATSRGRIAVPIFARNPRLAVTVAMGDFRWQVAKEMAGYHWMDEGLTARYYEYLTSNKIKGDIKMRFISDYVLWITKESEGIQKLESQDLRYIFWRFVPFPDKLKEELSKRGFYYNDLYKKEMSYRMSQGLE
ncbi:MAG: hypothetical protein N2258_02560 [Brevinematales bacterium]|nr:hypothetical protein [Brevinematales bacterium]